MSKEDKRRFCGLCHKRRMNKMFSDQCVIDEIKQTVLSVCDICLGVRVKKKVKSSTKIYHDNLKLICKNGNNNERFEKFGEQLLFYMSVVCHSYFSSRVVLNNFECVEVLKWMTVVGAKNRLEPINFGNTKTNDRYFFAFDIFKTM